MQQHSSTRLACGGMLAMAAAIGIGRFVYTPILPIMIESLKWGNADAGFVASSNFLGYLLGSVAATRRVSPGRQRFWLLAALLLSAATTAGMALDSHLVMLGVLRLVGGAASAFVIVLASTLVLERLSAAQRGDLSAIHFAGVGAGIILSAALVSTMLAARDGWQALWAGAGAIALLATALVAVLIPQAPVPPTSIPPSPIQSKRGLTKLIAAYGLFGFGYVITATFLVTIVRMTPEVRPLEAWIWVLFGFAAVPSVALWSWVGQRLGLMAAFALACLIEAAGVAASVEWVTTAGVCFSAILLGGTFMGITALGLIAARRLSGPRSQSAIGLMTVSFATGQMIGPMIAGVLSDSLGGLRIPSLAAAIALLAAAVLALASARANADPSSDPSPGRNDIPSSSDQTQPVGIDHAGPKARLK